MKYCSVVLFGALTAVVAVAAAPLAGQTTPPAASAGATRAASLQRTPWGDPDLQGIWRGLSRVPLERPVGFEDKELFTEADVAARTRPRETRHPGDPLPDSIGFRGLPIFSTAWQGDGPTKQGRVDRRTSAITDPPNGRLPAWTPQAIERRETQEVTQRGRGEADSWEDRWWWERCIVAFTPPLVTNWGMAYSGREGVAVEGSFSANPGPVMRRFLQTPGYVAITMEEGTAGGVEAGGYRIIPLDGRPAVGSKYRSWMGKSRGHWDGDTLVVVTRNIYYDDPILTTYGEKPRYPGTGETLTVTERYKRLDADSVEWSYTIEDSEAYTRPYTVIYTVMQYLTRDDDFKVAPELCRENNWRNLGAILANARSDEQVALKFAEESARQRQKRFEELKAEWAAAAAAKSTTSRQHVLQ